MNNTVDVGSPWTIVLSVAAIVIALPLVVVWRKGRPFAAGSVFRASRLSAGNHLFPTQVQITPSSIVHHTPFWIGRSEHTIHIAHVSSVRIDTGAFFSDVYIETSGGASPVKCHGHRKRDALEMQRLIEQFQTAYYRQPTPATPAPSVGDADARR